ncbi:hypothetical protein EVAR_90934_1 [Eumeta japonica]|uniref:DNA helicase n=1 Tax=Eumeta variegata TaxID=151549 RepID=A0A4C1SN20_EUMVA|nr:hypothetical protein EVAR_90934_1 [Eumeta japonica]
MRNTLQHSRRRENPILSFEQYRNTQEHSRRRQSSTQRSIEQERNTHDHFMHRRNPDYQEIDRERNTASHFIRRSNPAYRSFEQARNTRQRREARQQARNRMHDISRMMNVRVRIHRLNPYNRERENLRQIERIRQARQNISPESHQQLLLRDSQRHTDHMLSEFNQCIKNGPTEGLRLLWRFGIPYPPMPSTEILLPLPEDTNADDLEKYQQNFANIHALLNAKLSNEEEDQVGSFEQFLKVSVQEASYNILGMHLSQCSNADVFINTFLPEKKEVLTSAYFRNLKTSETQGLCNRLVLKISAKYMMTVNINTSDGLVNGASGVLMGIDLQLDSRCPATLWVLFEIEMLASKVTSRKPFGHQ